MAKPVLNIIKGNQGAGKTVRLREIATRNAGRYLFACPTIELIGEQEKELQSSGLLVRSFHSGHRRNGKNEDQPVFKLLLAAKENVEATGQHAIFFITHETLMSNDFSDFIDWHLLIDEAPSAVDGSLIGAAVFKEAIMPKLNRVASSNGWGVYRLAQKASFMKVKNDTAASKLATFLKQASRSTGVVIDEHALQAKDKISWFSYWSPLLTPPFASIHIAASNYEGSLGYKFLSFLSDGQFELKHHIIGGTRTAQPTVAIRYFAEDFTGSTTWWTEVEDGQKSMVEVSRWLEDNEPNLGFWSCNNDLRLYFLHRLAGSYISPMAMGLNEYRDETRCAFIFSNKKKADDAAKLDAGDIGVVDLLDARETEVIRQFIMRGAIRNAAYAGDYTIYLYEKGQAEAIREHLSAHGFTNVAVSPVVLPYTSGIQRKYAKGINGVATSKADRNATRAANAKADYDAAKIETIAQKIFEQGVHSYEELDHPRGLAAKKHHLISEIERRAAEIWEENLWFDPDDM